MLVGDVVVVEKLENHPDHGRASLKLMAILIALVRGGRRRIALQMVSVGGEGRWLDIEDKAWL